MANLPALRRTAAPKQGTTHWSRIARLPAREREKSAERTAPPDSLQTHRKLYQAVKHALETHTGKAITTADGQLLSGIVLGLLARHKENALSALNPDDPELEKKLQRIWTTWGIQKLAPTNATGGKTRTPARVPAATIKKLVSATRAALSAGQSGLTAGQQHAFRRHYYARTGQPRPRTPSPKPVTLNAAQKAGARWRIGNTRRKAA